MVKVMVDSKVRELMYEAKELAISNKLEYVIPEVILKAFLADKNVIKRMKEYGVEVDVLKESLDNYIDEYPLLVKKEGKSEYSALSDLFVAGFMASKLCTETIKDETIKYVINVLTSLNALDNTFVKSALEECGAGLECVSKMYEDNIDSKDTEAILKMLTEAKDDLQSNPEIANMVCKKYLYDYLKVEGKNNVALVGRKDELTMAQQILLRKEKPNLLVIGKEGVGKKRLVYEAVKKLSKKFTGYTVYGLDLNTLTAGVVLKGELETRVASIYTGLKDSGQTILVIPDLQRICSSDNSLQGEVLNAIKPMFRNAYVKIIGTMTYEDFRKAYEKDDVFETSFYKLPIEELSLNDTKKIVKNFKKSYEKYFGCEYSDDSLEAIVDCAKRFMSNRQFPEKALDIMDMVGAASKYTGNATVTESTVYQTVSTMLNLPLQNISKKECDLYKSLAENLGKEIIGQEEAITKVSDAVIVARSGLRESNKTAISLLFTGSSGCGKSELCRVLARLMNLPLVRFDMSEYMEEHSVSKLLGAPPGYKDSGNGKAGNGLLINEIEEHPNCILMLDEIEKAHPKVHNLLLQVMDNGQLTSSIGKSVSFENVFLIMTSNVGSKVAHKTNIGFMDNGNKPSTEEYDETFLPEFRSRLDATVVFNNLSDNVLRDISKKFLGELTQILKEKHIKFNYNENVLGYIVDKVKAINNGARPIKHIITNEIKNVIAKDIVFGKYVNGGNIMVELENEKLSFKG